jgi:hypothetical protein
MKVISDNQQRTGCREVFFPLHMDIGKDAECKGDAAFEDATDEPAARIFDIFGHGHYYTQEMEKYSKKYSWILVLEFRSIH